MEEGIKTNGRIILIAILIILTSIIALSAHVLILHYFEPPIIHIDLKANDIVSVIVHATAVIGAMLIYWFSRTHWRYVKPFYSVILFALLIMALSEQLFRIPLMEIMTGVPWEYQLLATLPTYVAYITLSALILFFVPLLSKKKKIIFLEYLLFVIIATASIIFIKKISTSMLSPLLSFVSPIDLSKLIKPPYKMNVMLPAYLTFLEPTIACFIMFYLIKDNLTSFNIFTKGLVMWGLIILVHGGIYSLMQIVMSEGNIFYRVFYSGQFLWEYFILGTLTAYSCSLFNRGAK